MSYNDNEASVTISRKRYAVLVIAEKDAERLKAIICDAADDYKSLSHAELKVLRNLLIPKEAYDEGVL